MQISHSVELFTKGNLTAPLKGIFGNGKVLVKSSCRKNPDINGVLSGNTETLKITSWEKYIVEIKRIF